MIPLFARSLLALLATQVPAPVPDAAHEADGIRVVQESVGCFHRVRTETAWVAKPDAFVWGERVLARAEVLEIAKTICGARREVPDLLAEVGLTPEALAAHRGDILAAVMPAAFKAGGSVPSKFPPQLEPLLAWEVVSPQLDDELHQRRWGSTSQETVRAELRVDGHVIVAESASLVPWRLPWTITVDGRSFKCDDLAVPRAVARIADPAGPCASDLDGARYWAEGIWSNASFWERVVGDALDAELSAVEYRKLAGWERAAARFRVAEVMTGNINLLPESMFFELRALAPAAIEHVRWHNFLLEGRPQQNFEEFLSVYDAASAAVSKQKWLLDWKACRPGRTLLLDAAGTIGMAETMVDWLVQPAWDHAGFQGAPQFEIGLIEPPVRDRELRGEWCGTVYLATDHAAALIESARQWPSRKDGTEKPSGAAGRRAHWFDDLAFSFHPNGDPPTYARVDSQGRCELRTMESPKRRRQR